MLSECNAFIVAPSPAESQQLERMAERVGFGDIVTSFAPRALSHGQTFFVMHYQLRDSSMRAIIDQVRHSQDADTRFAPIVLFTDDCPVDRLLGYIKMGFDDVIALPEKREVLEARLAAQLNTEQAYFETDDYLGPDRRRMELPSHRDERRTGTTPFGKVIFRRDATQGVSLLRRHMLGQPQRPQPNETTHFMPRPYPPGAVASRFMA
jgi:DNA-binding response OmpR family regulator